MKISIPLAHYLAVIIIILLVCFSSAAGVEDGNISCSSVFSCGDFHNIKCPFTLQGNTTHICPRNCSGPRRQLVCENNRTVLYISSLTDVKFFVSDISYKNHTIRLLDQGLQRDNCSSIPRYSSSVNAFENFTMSSRSVPIIYTNCSEAMVDSPQYIEASHCTNASSSNLYYLYVLISPLVTDFKGSCNNFLTSWMMMRQHKHRNASFSDVHDELMNGFELNWWYEGYEHLDNSLFSRNLNHRDINNSGQYSEIIKVVAWILLGRSVLVVLCLVALLIYMLRQRHRAMDTGIEVFLDKCRNQRPMRYSYMDIKRMTNNFKEKLGEGGFGSVFKGCLRSGRPVAIKVLGTSKGNGQDFINEVASLGRIHHVNVVQLIGFVAERSKRALIYEFMANGSLDNYIFPQNGKFNLLSWEKTYEIALGIAHGIEYLHRGCDMRILHFDIKPYNILLDENYVPKVSDFGLARLYSMDESVASLTAARGTIGYMAPELFYRTIGAVSYKSDVYSFGMLLMEMAGRRKNVNALAEKSSQIYFPSWIYDRLDQGDNIEIEDASDEEKEIAKKMIIVALWCIQMKPIDRPSVTKVVEMLEGTLGLLQMPPKPFFTADPDGHANDTSSTEISSLIP